MSDTRENRPLADLLGGLATDISMLFRKEVQLAKVEASEKVSQALAGVASIAIGGVLALGALGVFLTAVVALLAAFLVSQGMGPTLANALSAIVVTVVVGLAGWVSISKGVSALKANNLNMNRTAASLGRDADVVKERL
ncbi:phage holin family protein [Devosia neptuniae]|uniref:phage holin family protein n=1 Tax=Devosia neptuniae TaxID=191302 RepID=UPI0022AFCB7A|nr:phage holin family protein [Devosia neptuniae]MCZ4345508.1 phage holin family protein [Devosia neptuniae]|tara:strand:- start:2408 stop:2824 length:417 start_codon:yes stop_codon:yes gene_type:complete